MINIEKTVLVAAILHASRHDRHTQGRNELPLLSAGACLISRELMKRGSYFNPFRVRSFLDQPGLGVSGV